MPNRVNKTNLTVNTGIIRLADNIYFADYEDIEIKLSSLRAVNSKIGCALVDNKTCKLILNSETLSTPRTEYSTSFNDITHAFDSPKAFLDHFNIKTIGKTCIRLAISIEEIPDNAPQVLKDFYNEKLAPAKLQPFLKAVEKEINNNKKNEKNDVKVKDNLIKHYFNHVRDSVHRDALNIIVVPTLMINLGLAVIGTAASLAAFFNISALMFVGLAATLIIAAPFYGLMSYSQTDKEQVKILNKLGALENENMNTPENANKLCKRLSNLLTIHDSYCSQGLILGEKSFQSSFNRFASFFNTKAYNAAYYVGQEMAEKKALRK